MKKQFIYGMLVAFLLVLLYVYRKKIFGNTAATKLAAPSKTDNKTTLQTLPDTEGSYIRKQIADLMMQRVKETQGNQDDSMLDNERRVRDISQSQFAKDFDISLLATNQVIRNDARRGVVYCSCGCPCGGGCGCPDQSGIS